MGKRVRGWWSEDIWCPEYVEMRDGIVMSPARSRGQEFWVKLLRWRKQKGNSKRFRCRSWVFWCQVRGKKLCDHIVTISDLKQPSKRDRMHQKLQHKKQPKKPFGSWSRRRRWMRKWWKPFRPYIFDGLSLDVISWGNSCMQWCKQCLCNLCICKYRLRKITSRD